MPNPSPYPYRPPSAWGSIFRFLTGTLFGVSVGLNLLMLLFILAVVYNLRSGTTATPQLNEKVHSGNRSAAAKVAIVQIDGVIIEGMLEYARQQIDSAAADDDVKAVVIRINSPGGSITASDEIFHRLTMLRDGRPNKDAKPKPLTVSMGSLAASGGYYIAMPAKQIVAERTSITGSIGVYAAFPNVKELADKWGVKMEVIKRGEVKASGSMFHDMTPPERQVWEDLINHAYDQFLEVVREGRGDRLKFGLRDPIPPPKAEDGGAKPAGYERRLADGGVFTADQAEKFGLIDRIGYLDSAIELAAKEAGLGENFKAITYEKPRSLLGSLLGVEAAAPLFDVAQIANSALPRIWYLAPECGLAGIVSAVQSVRP